jgi:hypothetical protein
MHTIKRCELMQFLQLFCMFLQAAAAQLDHVYLTLCWVLCADINPW